MSGLISPAPVTGGARKELPAYVANGVIGLRVREIPLTAGMALVNGYAGEHPVRGIESAAIAPYPLAGDLQLAGVWLSDALFQSAAVDQAYDFSCGELTSRFTFEAGDVKASVEVLTFASRDYPTLVCQEIAVTVDAPCQVVLRGALDGRNLDGRAVRQMRDTPGEDEPACDGALLWESAGAMGRCGIAYTTELVGDQRSTPDRPPMANAMLVSDYALRATAGRTVRLRQIAALVPSVVHRQSDFEAVRRVALGAKLGFEALRAANREAWAQLWQGRIRLVGAPRRWQALADAAFYYLMSSTHTASPASTSIFGLAMWHDYHYYYGHVMWDIETFCVPVLSLLQPGAAYSILDYRSRNLECAAANARLAGRRGLQFPWESAPFSGEEAAPLPGTAAWHEDHVSLDVALAFASHADATGDGEFLRTRAWPVLAGVADWVVSRVTRSDRGFEIRAAMGIAERQASCDNPAFTNMSAIQVLRAAIAAAGRMGVPADPRWGEIAADIVLPMRGPVMVSHDGYRSNEEKGGTPDPLMGVFPLGFPMAPGTEAATLNYYLALKDDYIGSPMLSALYGVWAAYAGDRALAGRLLDEGYGQFCVGRFDQTLEYRADVFPEQPRAGPFFANLAGFLGGLLLGFPGLRPGLGDPASWAERPVVLPEGWRAIEVDRMWVRQRHYRLLARQGDERARLEAV